LAEESLTAGHGMMPQCKIDLRVSFEATVSRSDRGPATRRTGGRSRSLPPFMARHRTGFCPQDLRNASPPLRRSGIEAQYSRLEDFGQRRADHFNFFPNQMLQSRPYRATAKAQTVVTAAWRLPWPNGEPVTHWRQAGCSATDHAPDCVSCTDVFVQASYQLIQRLGIASAEPA